MGLKRFIGVTEQLPNRFIEIVSNQNKKPVYHLLYDQDGNIIPLFSLNEEDRFLVTSFQKKDLKQLNNQEFKDFIAKRSAWKKGLKKN